MKITSKQYKRINNDKELEKAKSRLTIWFNLSRRLAGFKRNELSGRIEGKCMACGKIMALELFSDSSIMNGRDFHASHLHDKDKFPNLEYCEDNVWLSCNRCNSPFGLHGNKVLLNANIIKEIGQERFDELERKRHTINKQNILAIDELIKEFKAKAKLQAKELGIKI